MSRVELVFDKNCPNVDAARAALSTSLKRAGLPVKWQEWDRASPAIPTELKGLGSPAIVINGRDVAGVEGGGSSSCRVYPSPNGELVGVPSSELLLSVLHDRQSKAGRFRQLLPVLSAIGVSLLPKLSCPACWPAYAGLLSAIGLGFLVSEKYLLPFTAAFLLLAAAVLGFRARSRHGYGPMMLGVVAGGLVLNGKFILASNAITYFGIGVLVLASLWNSWPRTAAETPSCPACAGGGAGSTKMAQRS